MKYHFSIPGIPETKDTLKHPIAIRLIPWLIVVGAAIDFLHSYLPNIQTAIGSPYLYSFQNIAYTLLTLLGLLASYALASRLKQGDKLFIWIALLWSILTLVGTMTIFAQNYFAFGQFGAPFSSLSLSVLFKYAVRLIINGYIIYAIWKYRTRIESGAKSFQEESPHDATEDLRRHRWAILLVVLPVLLGMLFNAWSWIQIRQQFSAENNRFICAHPSYQDIRPGLSKAEVRSVLGAPTSTQGNTNAEDNLGAQGGLEKDVREAWSYEVSGWVGHIEVYFNDQEEVVGTNCGRV